MTEPMKKSDAATDLRKGVRFTEHGTHKTIDLGHRLASGHIRVSDQSLIDALRDAFEKAGYEVSRMSEPAHGSRETGSTALGCPRDSAHNPHDDRAAYCCECGARLQNESEIRQREAATKNRMAALGKLVGACGNLVDANNRRSPTCVYDTPRETEAISLVRLRLTEWERARG